MIIYCPHRMLKIWAKVKMFKSPCEEQIELLVELELLIKKIEKV